MPFLRRTDARRRRHLLHGSERNVSQLGRLDVPLGRVIEEAHLFAAQHIRKSEKLHDLFFREYPEYPTFAWQEAIINAVAHRDYSVQGLEIEVWFYEDRMEVKSPGGLLPPLTIEAISSGTPVHVSRNPLLVRVLVDAGIMREEGEGIPRMIEEMEESFLRRPQFSEEYSVFQVTLFNTPILDSGRPEWQAVVERLPISINQSRILVGRPDGFTSSDYQQLNRVQRDQAYREIQQLVDLGILAPAKSRGRGVKYHVSPNLRRDRLWMEAVAPKLRIHFATKDTLTNSDYQGILGVSRDVAKRELRRLVELGWVIAQGERRGAHYIPGPKLPE